MTKAEQRLIGVTMMVRELDRRSAREAVALALVADHLKDTDGIDYIRAYREASRERQECQSALINGLADIRIGGYDDA